MTSLFFLPRVVVCRQCVCCVCVGGLFSLSLVQFLSQHFFFGGVGNPTTTSLLRLSIRFCFFFFFLFLVYPVCRFVLYPSISTPLYFVFHSSLISFFLYLLCGRVRLIYIYIHILLCVCVCCILSLGRKKKKSNNFFGHILFSFPGGIYYYILYAIYFYFSAKFIDKNNR